MLFSYFAGNIQLNQHLFPAKCVYQAFAGNADKRHRGGVSETPGHLSTIAPTIGGLGHLVILSREQ